jgi:hypothetical protein
MNEENKDIVIDEEAFKQMILDSHKYIYNLMGFSGEYSEEAFLGKFEELKADNEKRLALFTAYTGFDKQLDLVHVQQGYGYFGKEFVKNLLDKDKDSAYHVVENLIQEYLDLQEFMFTTTAKLEEASKKFKDSESNSVNS